MSPDASPVSPDLASRVATAAQELRVSVGCAESLTSGAIAAALGAAEGASDWFRGGVVAYASKVKFEVLQVPRGPVVTAECAAAMADNVAKLLSADYTVAVTGVGGPEPEEGEPAGTVYLAVRSPRGTTTVRHQFDGDPSQVVQATTGQALRMLREALHGGPR